MSRGVAARLTEMMQEKREGNNDLTNRELQVMRLLVDGQTNAEISLNLGISAKTVEKHLDAVYRKLGANSRVEAAVTALKKNIVEPS